MKKELDLAIDNFVKSSQTFYDSVDELTDKLAAIKEEYAASIEELHETLEKAEEAHKRSIQMLGTYKGERVYSITVDDYWSHKDIYDGENNYYILIDYGVEDPFVVWKGKALFTYNRMMNDFDTIERRDIGDIYPMNMRYYKMTKIKETLAQHVQRDKKQ